MERSAKDFCGLAIAALNRAIKSDVEEEFADHLDTAIREIDQAIACVKVGVIANFGLLQRIADWEL